MLKLSTWTLRFAALMAVLALATESASARPFGGRGGGFGGRGGYYGGRGYDGWGGFGLGYYGGYYGDGYYGGGYYGGYYGPSTYYPSNTVIATSPGYQSNYYSPSSSDDMTATINVHVPPTAQVWFDDAPTRQTGEMRSFSSPPLESGKMYHYTVRAQWNDNGKPVDQTRRIEVRAGGQTQVDFLRPDTLKSPTVNP